MPRSCLRKRCSRRWLEAFESRLLCAADPTVIDLLGLYTPATLAAEGSVSSVSNRLAQSVVQTNRALANSRINAVIRVVGLEEVDYTETGAMATDIARLRDPADGFMDEAPSLRDSAGADLVSLLVSSGDFGGLAYQPDSVDTPDDTRGYSIVLASAAGVDYTFAHEIGHNLGAGHDHGDATIRGVPYAYGQNFSYEGFSLGDIMASGTHVPLYSGPELTWNGVTVGAPAGSAAPADNARAMRLIAPIVANYRPSVYLDTVAPTAALGPTTFNVNTRVLTIAVDLADDTALDVASLNGSTLAVTDGTFTGTATLISKDTPAGVTPAAIGALYRVTLPAGVDPAILSVSLEPGIADIVGNVSAGGVLEAYSSVLTEDAGYAPYDGFDARTIKDEHFHTLIGYSPDDPQTFVHFTLDERSTVQIELAGKTAPANVVIARDVNGNGVMSDDPTFGSSFETGLDPDSIDSTLDPGSYFAWVFTASGNGTADFTLRSAVAGAPVDSDPPTATTATPAPELHATDYSFTVIYNDNDTIVPSSVSGDNVVRVTGPNGYDEFATFVSLDNTPGPHTRIATYRVPAPAGEWSPAANGDYAVILADGVAKDQTGNTIAGGTIGSFSVALVPDAFPPTAVATLRDVFTPGGGAYRFTVAYADDNQLDQATVLANKTPIVVSGPGAFLTSAKLASFNRRTGQAVYRFVPPGKRWDASDAGTYTLTLQANLIADTDGNATPGTTLGTFYMTPTPLFDEHFYLAKNADVSAAVAAGDYGSGYAQFIAVGQFQERDPSPFFSTALYTRLYPAVADAVAAGKYESPFAHFLKVGMRRGYVSNAMFDPRQYARLTGLGVGGALLHYITRGQFQNRRPSAYFDLGYYVANNPGVSDAVKANGLHSAFEHFLLLGEKARLPATPYFDENYYMTLYPDVAVAVVNGQYASGYEHFVLVGQFENRKPAANIDPAAYAARYPDVARAVVAGRYASAWCEYVLNGVKRGRDAS